MIDKMIRNSPIFGEFLPEDQVRYFSFSKEKVTNHVDTFYYTVKIEGDTRDPREEVLALLDRLSAARNKKAFNPSLEVTFFDLGGSRLFPWKSGKKRQFPFSREHFKGNACKCKNYRGDKTVERNKGYEKHGIKKVVKADAVTDGKH